MSTNTKMNPDLNAGMNRGGTRAWIRPVVALLAGLLFFLPIYLVLVNVFKDGSAIVSNPVGLPVPPTLDNIRSVLSRPDHLFWYGLVNSTEVTVISILVITAVSAMLGHYLARSTGFLSKVIMVVLLCGLMVPPAVILTPITEVLRTLGLMSSVPGLVLAYVGYYMPFGVFVFAGFAKTIPENSKKPRRSTAPERSAPSGRWSSR